MKIKFLERTCFACPSQWEGVTECGLGIYVRYRHGHLSIDINGESILEKDIGDSLDGYMTEEELEHYLKEAGLEY